MTATIKSNNKLNRLTSAEYADMNNALESAAVPPWDREFEAREKHKKLFSMVEASLDAGDIMFVTDAARDVRPWTRVCREANNRIVGVALVDAGCSMKSPSRRTAWEQRLAIHGTPPAYHNQLVSFRVLDVACIGSFGQMCPENEGPACDVPAGSVSLLPVYAAVAASSNAKQSITQASLAMECIDTLLNLPCYRNQPFEGHPGAGFFCLCNYAYARDSSNHKHRNKNGRRVHVTVGNLIVDHWCRTYPMLRETLSIDAAATSLSPQQVPSLAIRVWTPLAVCVLHKRARHIITAKPIFNNKFKNKHVLKIHSADLCLAFARSNLPVVPAQAMPELEPHVPMAKSFGHAHAIIAAWVRKSKDRGFVSEAEALISFLDNHIRSLRLTKVEHEGIATHHKFSAEALIRMLKISTLVTNNDKLGALLSQALAFVLPAPLLAVAEEQMKHAKVPSATTVSRSQRILDASYCMEWRRRWSMLYAQESSGWYMMGDSSPQCGQDWFLQFVRIAEDAVAIYRAKTALVLAHSSSSSRTWDEWAAWLLDRTPLELGALRQHTRALNSAVSTHWLIPTACGSKRGSALHKVHNMIHALYADCGSWSSVEKFLKSLISYTSDQGTERLLSQVPYTLAELRQTSWCPKFEDMEDESTDLLGSDSGNLFDTTNNIQ